MESSNKSLDQALNIPLRMGIDVRAVGDARALRKGKLMMESKQDRSLQLPAREQWSVHDKHLHSSNEERSRRSHRQFMTNVHFMHVIFFFWLSKQK